MSELRDIRRLDARYGAVGDALDAALPGLEGDMAGSVGGAKAERYHRRSFAWGNIHLHNPAITRPDIDREADRLKVEREAPKGKESPDA